MEWRETIGSDFVFDPYTLCPLFFHSLLMLQDRTVAVGLEVSDGGLLWVIYSAVCAGRSFYSVRQATAIRMF